MIWSLALSRMRKLVLFLIFSLSAWSGFSQNLERYNWYFGGSTQAVRFNRTSGKPSIVTKAVPFGTAGGGTASSATNANLLFYTDGKNVYDASNTLISGLPVGGLSGNANGNQPVAMCAVPGSPGKYFLFTNSASYTTPGSINMSIVDMNLPGNAVFPTPPLGALTAPINVATGLTGFAEGMTIVPHTNGVDFWLIIAQQPTATSTTFSAALINAASAGGTFTFPSPSLVVSPPILAGNIAYNSKRNIFAVSAQDPNTDAIILSFDPATGAITGAPVGVNGTIRNSGTATGATNQSIYDIEWSANSNFLYLSRFGDTGIQADLFQYDYTDQFSPLTSILPAPVFRSFGVQMAPDSNIYHLYQAASGGSILIGAITAPDSVAAKVKYKTSQVTSTNLQGIQFPSFAPRSNVVITVDFTSIGTCQNNNTTFFPAVTPAPDSVNWDFGDGGKGSNDWSPVHKYGQAQTFSVKLTAFVGGQTQSVTKPVTITNFTLKISLVQDTTACRSEFPPPRGTSSPVQFSVTAKADQGTPTSWTWSNGDTGPTLKPAQSGYYYVVATDATGCSTYAGVNVKEYGLQDQRSNIWFFGNQAGIDFNQTPPVPLTNSAMDAPEGCAIICDRNGKTIFYTDGETVYNKNDIAIATGIGGSKDAAQSSIIVAVPGDETLYYIFTNEAIEGGTNITKYSLFDLKQNAGLGAVTVQNQVLFSRSTERITASGKWIIIHEWGNNTFRVYPFNGQGIGEPILTAIGSDHVSTSINTGIGYMKLGPKNNLAVALSQPGANLIELFHVNDTTGKITNYRKIDLNDASGQVYGLEFSPGARKLFATVRGSNKIYEYAIDYKGKPYLAPSPPATGTNPITQNNVGELQIAPDGQIYVAIEGSGSLGRFAPDEDSSRLSINGYVANAFNLAGKTSHLGLPNFIQHQSNAFGGPDFSFTGLCLGDTTRFLGVPTDAIDKFQWQFDATASFSAASQSPKDSTVYPTAGNHIVTMRITNRCITSPIDVTKTVTINDLPPPLDVYYLYCPPPEIGAYKVNIPGLTYLWPNGETTRVIHPTEPTQGTLVVTNQFGCPRKGLIFYDNLFPSFGPDQVHCQNEVLPALQSPYASNPQVIAAWYINGVATGVSGSQPQPINTATPGTYKYELTGYINDANHGPACTFTGSVTYTINPGPVFTLTSANTSGCGNTDGTITLTPSPSTPPGGPYSLFFTGPGGFNDQLIDQAFPHAAYVYNQPGHALGAGVYSATVQDQISQCAITQSVAINDTQVGSATAAPVNTCDPETIQITTSGMSFPIQYQAINNATPSTIIGPFTENALTVFNMPTALSAGTYTITLKYGTCTFSINNFVVTPTTPVAVTVTPNVCASPPTLTASAPGLATYAWTGPGIVGPANQATVTVSGQGQFTYSVTVTPAAGCPNTVNQVVILDTPVPDFTQSDACQSNVVLKANLISSAYTYRWYKAGVFQSGLQGAQIVIGTADDNASYQVEYYNPQNGCSFKSNPKTVRVIGVVTAGITASPACADGKPFTLTAVTSATGVTYAWFKSNTLIAGQTSATTSQTDETTYKVEISKATCKATSQVTVLRNPLPVGTLPNRATICNDPDNKDPKTNNVDLDPGTFTKYDWYKNELSLNYTAQVYNATSQGIYRVDLTNSFGCVASDQTEVRSECIPQIDVPNAFRPSSSITENKDFYAFTFFITDTNFQVFIYNRWGELVYTSADRDFKWNGGYNNNLNQPLPGGSYAWVIKYVSSFHPERGVQEKRGGVALLR